MAKKRYVTTKADLAVFEKECRRLCKVWGLTGWNLCFQIGCADDNSAAASLTTDIPQRDAIFCLSSWFNKRPASSKIREWARHETIHLVTEPMLAVSQWRYIRYDEILAAAHEVLGILDKLLPR